MSMKEITAILAFLLLLTGCGKSSDVTDSPPKTDNTTTVSAEEKIIVADVITTTSTASAATETTVTEPITTAAQKTTTATSITPPVSTTETAVSSTKAQSTDNTAQSEKTPYTTTSAVTTANPIAPTTIQQTTLQVTTVSVTEPNTEPQSILSHDGTDYGKAKAVYEYMQQNGHGACINYACRTYEMCQEVGLPCYIVWTNAGMYGHVANTVKIGDIWYILDAQGGYFLDYNYCFTEVVDIDGNHIADGDILSNYSYNELN